MDAKNAKVSAIREKAAAATKRMADKMIENDCRKYQRDDYNAGDKVFLRFGKLRKGSTRHSVILATVLKKYKDDTYKFQFFGPDRNVITTSRVNVENMADYKRCGKVSRRQALRKKLFIPLSKLDRQQPIVDQGFQIFHDPPPNSNCQFNAMANSLATISLFTSAERLSEQVQYPHENDVR